MITRYEASDDGWITKDGSSYTVTDYETIGAGQFCLRIYIAASANEKRGYKRFLMNMPTVTFTLATLYWYLVSVDPDSGCTTACKLEQISDYGILDATAAEYTGTVSHDYGNVMAYNTAAGWKSQDVTAEMEASKADAYVAFRWRGASVPGGGDIDYRIGAYEDATYKAYLQLTYTTGWQHTIDKLTPAGTAKINALLRTTGIAKVNGL